MAYYDPTVGGFGSSDAPDLSNDFKKSKYQDWQNKQRDQASAMQNNFAQNFSVPDPVEAAKRIQQFNIQANQPAIQSMQSSVAPLQKRYTDLVDSIKGAATTASNYAQRSTSSNLGRRGLMPQSEEGQMEISNALQPITAQTQGQIAQTGMAQEKDLADINKAIALLQSGNPEAAMASGLQYSNQQQSANQFGQDLALRQRAAELASQQQQAELANQAQRSPLELELLKAQVAKAQQTGGSGDTTANDFLMKILGGQTQQAPQATKAPSWFTPTPTVNIFKGMPGLTF